MREEFYSESEADTRRIANEVCARTPVNSVITLTGDLGAGKTTFVKGVAEFCGISGPITSPTFNIFNMYSGRINLVHMDAYRLSSAHDFEALMVDEFLVELYFFVVEWPENVAAALPKRRINVTIEGCVADSRKISVEF